MNEERLPARYYNISLPQVDRPKPVPEDAEKLKRRRQILEIMQRKFVESPFEQRLGRNNGHTPSVSDIVNRGLLGFLSDETLISDIIPQGHGEYRTDKLSHDPLWKHIAAKLTVVQKQDILAIFRTIERTSRDLEDENANAYLRISLGNNRLNNLYNARLISPGSWAKLSGIGHQRAELIYNSFKKTA